MVLKLYKNNSTLSVERVRLCCLDKGKASIGDIFWSCSAQTPQYTMCFLWITLNLTPETSTNCHIPPTHLPENKETHPKEGWVCSPNNIYPYPLTLEEASIPMGSFQRLWYQNMAAKHTSHDGLPGREGRNSCCALLSDTLEIPGVFLPHNGSSREELYRSQANLLWKIRGACP